ncbi:hypothetical protein AB1L42_15555 [Thalassoglobus sp. JC818]|uniref:hypothetical protein n=1 Tax=Thalassoglobus sp. JC818 TaxID=3232136 RepID=UPI003457E797
MAAMAGRQFSIDLESSRWNFWGTVGEQKFDDGSWWDGPPAETPEPASNEQHRASSQKRSLVRDSKEHCVPRTK